MKEIYFYMPYEQQKYFYHQIDNDDVYILTFYFDKSLNSIMLTYIEAYNKNMEESCDYMLIKQPARNLYYEFKTRSFILSTTSQYNRRFMIAQHPIEYWREEDGESVILMREDSRLYFALKDLFVSLGLLTDNENATNI